MGFREKVVRKSFKKKIEVCILNLNYKIANFSTHHPPTPSIITMISMISFFYYYYYYYRRPAILTNRFLWRFVLNAEEAEDEDRLVDSMMLLVSRTTLSSLEEAPPHMIGIDGLGKDGIDGIDGRDGMDGRGKDGMDGRGKDGIDGRGKDGMDGMDGMDGRGKDGIGRDGMDGKDGKDGMDGRGKDGKDGTNDSEGVWKVDEEGLKDFRDFRDFKDFRDRSDKILLAFIWSWVGDSATSPSPSSLKLSTSALRAK